MAVELVQVQYGGVTIGVAGQSVTLDVGDAIAYPGDVAHLYANSGPEPARFSPTVFPPNVRPGARPAVTDA